MAEIKKEKKGELLNQLAIICDLIEKANIKLSDNGKSGLVFSLPEDEFSRIVKYFDEKSDHKQALQDKGTLFYVYMGDIQIMFMIDPLSKSNV